MTQTNAADRRQVRKAEKIAERAEMRKKDFLREALSTQGGKEYFWELLERAHIFQTTFMGEALGSAYHEGERNLGLQVLGDITKYCPEKLIEMMQDHNTAITVATMELEDVDGTDEPDAPDGNATGE
jgi:hypothetical protein